ncbi:hypothetical protein [Leptospira interrogans]|uniref:hypothetical protein n=1 Tax=Leptospira interrogans TaxID=173 RepID=UPI0003686348|nr:hypothetical protein [Leptospira interrogans]
MSGGQCNICKAKYHSCDHIEGMIYKGRLCRQINTTIPDINHTAIVQNPRDRRCIPLNVETSTNKWKDIFTQTESNIPKESDKSPRHQGKRISFIVFNNKRIDTD